MISIGRMCVKIAGRDAGKKCIIIDILEGPFVLIDGETRRKRCNISHLELLEEKVEIKKNASHEEIKEIFAKKGITITDTKPKQKTVRPKKLRRSKLAQEVKTETAKKPAAKTAEKKTKAKKATAEKPKKTVKKEE